MKNKLINNMIPVETLDNKVWYIDISELSLSELLKLRKALSTKSNVSIRPLDAIIHKTSNSTYDNMNFKKRDIEKKKQGYRNHKVFIRMRRQGR